MPCSARPPSAARSGRRSLALLAEAWLKEAEFSHKFDFSTSLGPRMQYDPFRQHVLFQLRPDVARDDDAAPGQHAARSASPATWSRTGRATPGSPCSTRGSSPSSPRSSPSSTSRSTRKRRRFPYIESLSATHPRQAKELAEEFLKTWTKNHDPNSQQLRRSRFFYVYGFESRRGGHPPDALEAGAQPGRAGRLGQEAARRCRSASSTRSCSPGPSPPATARPRSIAWTRSTRSSARSTPSSRSPWPS